MDEQKIGDTSQENIERYQDIEAIRFILEEAGRTGKKVNIEYKKPDGQEGYSKKSGVTVDLQRMGEGIVEIITAEDDRKAIPLAEIRRVEIVEEESENLDKAE